MQRFRDEILILHLSSRIIIQIVGADDPGAWTVDFHNKKGQHEEQCHCKLVMSLTPCFSYNWKNNLHSGKNGTRYRCVTWKMNSDLFSSLMSIEQIEHFRILEYMGFCVFIFFITLATVSPRSISEMTTRQLETSLSRPWRCQSESWPFLWPPHCWTPVLREPHTVDDLVVAVTCTFSPMCVMSAV